MPPAAHSCPVRNGEEAAGRIVLLPKEHADSISYICKNKKAAAGLTRQLTEGKIDKIYRAEVTGMIPKEEDILTDYLLKDGRTNTSRVVAQGTPKSKQAVLSYKRLSDSELEIRLMTGRHHQIRVQLSNAGMPIKGDRKYGRPDPDYHGRLMLTACRLSFIHPGTGKLMELSI